jgi:hypothetical protein
MGKPTPQTNPLLDTLNRGTLVPTQPRQSGPVGTVQTVSAPPPPALGQRVLQFAKDNLDQQVGDGQCFALADQALHSVGAASAADFGPVHAHTDYKWSSQRVNTSDAQPGDIIQFRNFSFKKRNDNADGSFSETEGSRGNPNHTAVVVSNDGAGNLIILEQNVNVGGSAGQADKTVRQNEIPTASMSFKSGTSTITVKVTGTMVVYRPMPKSVASLPSSRNYTNTRSH